MNKLTLSFCTGALLLLLTPFIRADDFTITKVKGENSVGKSPKDYESPTEGTQYPLGYWLKTHGRSSSMQIEFDPKYIVLLRPRSEVEISGKGGLSDRFQRVLDLKQGSVALDLEKLPTGGSIRVETPTAIGGAVGTEFSVDADTGAFEITEGSIHAKTKDDAIFSAESVSGRFSLKPGLENSYVEADHIKGSYKVNDLPMNASSFSVAKASGKKSDAAVLVDGKSMLIRNGSLEALSDSKKSIHSQYLVASKEEGSLFLKRESERATKQDTKQTDAALKAAAKRASALRSQLFKRDLARDAAKQGAKSALDAMRRR